MKKETEQKENITLKKIRYYQGTIKDFDTFWADKIKESQNESSQGVKDCKSKNEDLNKAFRIIPVTEDD
jgi:lipid II:glycine glycyltransferase (peptidoglycan interpeptide bridge formation enzyme)